MYVFFILFYFLAIFGLVILFICYCVTYTALMILTARYNNYITVFNTRAVTTQSRHTSPPHPLPPFHEAIPHIFPRRQDVATTL